MLALKNINKIISLKSSMFYPSNATDLFTPEPILDTPQPEEVNKDLVLEFFADEKP